MSIRVETLPMGRLRLRPGVGYVVASEFVDDDLIKHEVGESWLFLGFESPRMYPGYVLHVADKGGANRSFKLKWASRGQAPVVHAFDEYVKAPSVAVEVLLAAMPPDDGERLRSEAVLPTQGNGDAELLLEELRRLAENAATASDRSGTPNPYESIALELARLAAMVDQKIGIIMQGRFGG